MIDTHAHLSNLENSEEIISSMEREGLSAIVTIGTTVNDSKLNIQFASSHKNIFATVGIYPEYSMATTEDDLKTITELASDENVVAIGEIGLDYHSENYDKITQKNIFLRQLKIADSVGKPFCVHCRNAAGDVYEILSQNKNLLKNSGLMHCYSEGKEWYKKFLELGMYLSFSGNITYKHNDIDFIKDVPLDKILVETDSPYLSPVPHRGERNQPKNVSYVIEKLAEVLGMDFDELNRITTENAKRFYRLKLKN